MGLADTLSLMKGAEFVVADSRDAQVQAAVIDVPCLLPDAGRGDLHAGHPPKLQAHEAARAVADHLAAWIAHAPR
jgi:hypothetical protein